MVLPHSVVLLFLRQRTKCLAQNLRHCPSLTNPNRSLQKKDLTHKYHQSIFPGANDLAFTQRNVELPCASPERSHMKDENMLKVLEVWTDH